MAMLFYVKGRLTPERVKKVLFFIISFVAAILAFGSKQNTATLPLFILLYEWYFFQDLRIKISRKQFFLVAALGGTFAFIFYYYLGSSPFERLFFPGYGGRPFTMPQRLLTQPRVVLHYISLLLYPEPSRLNLDYDFPLSYTLYSPATTFFSILVIIGLLGMAIYTAKENRLYSFCILWFLGNLVIESSTIPLEIIFEHRTYLPSMLVILLFVLFLYQTVKKKRVLIVFLVSISLLFSYWTYARNKVWKDDLTFWTDIYKKSPDKARVNQYYGKALYAAGRINEAFPIIERALQLYEKQIGSQKRKISYELSTYNLNLGILYKDQGDYQKAIFYLNRSLNIFYYSTTAHYVIGLCYTQIGRYEEAINHLTKAMEFAKHSLTEIDGYSNVAKIEKSLKFAKMALKRQKDREYLLQKNLKR
jgi:tetratricopeptide (TPR) repeat protein